MNGADLMSAPFVLEEYLNKKGWIKMKKVIPFLMFQDGQAEEAMTFYTSIMADSDITNIVRYGKNGPGEGGTVMQATFKIKGQEFMCIDNKDSQLITFTHSISIYVMWHRKYRMIHLIN